MLLLYVWQITGKENNYRRSMNLGSSMCETTRHHSTRLVKLLILYRVPLLGIALVIILIFISYYSFINSKKSINDYLGSDAFRNVIITIVIPLVAFIWRIYDNKIKEREQDLKERRQEREQDLKEKRNVREQDLREKRIATIEKTSGEWDKINSLVSEVRFCEGQKDPKLKDIQLRIAQHSISFGELIYIWSSRFQLFRILPLVFS